jgi:uncharacterized protein YdeI (YjbR/CyaY-like superfamily)
MEFTMKNTLPEVDRYIEQAADFAKPILKRLRKLFHQACPQIREEMKWSFPHFVHQGIVGSMAGFKQHVSWGFWNAKKMPDPQGLLKESKTRTPLGFKPKSLTDLPPDEIILEYIRAAVALNEQGIKRPTIKRKPAAKIEVPKDLRAALKQNAKARATFEAFSSSHQREYIEWITEAKQQATRERRLATTLEWLTEGKSRNWKYKSC